MKVKFIALICSTMIALVAASSQALAQQKTVKACQEEWRANKAANQANGITEKSYVDRCRSAETATQPPAAPPPSRTATPAPSAPPPVGTSPAPPPAATPPAARPAPAPRTAAKPAPSTPGTPSGANQFATEAQAKARCPSDTVVWANLPSHIYHFNGYRNYGTTKDGAYMCEGDTAAAGFRAPKNEAHP
jgi:type IV secretory pathway VirB10-like protein